MTILITGINGFAGSHLARLLLNDGLDVSGTVLSLKDDHNIATFSKKLRIYPVDLRKPDNLEEVLKKEKPQHIYHLAGISFVKDSWTEALNVYQVNFLGTFHLLEAVTKSGLSSRILFAGSGEVYGPVQEAMLPAKEELKPRPITPYAVSKAAAELLCQQYFSSRGLPVVCIRAFNHIGPGQDSKFVCSSFAKQIAEIEAGMKEPVIRVGNLAAKRDFTDVRDIVRAYRLIMEKGIPGEAYNVCSGECHPIQSILDTTLKMSRVKIEIKLDKSRLRPADIPVLSGDNSKVTSLGWKKTITLEKSLEDILNHWRGSISRL